ncbi:MAG TPA: ribonuclease PH [Planctomycetota bacterium]|nr:ribonuclease PH [Planctomycetota bacterium]
MRPDGRADDELRPITFERHFNDHPAGSVLVSFGRTRVLCTASVEEGVPPWMERNGLGWVTAEYGMLPGSTGSRKAREGRTGRADSRALEISRFIGRCMRPVVDRKAIRDKTIWLDCDVLAADGGTRTAAVSGAYVALHDAVSALKLPSWPLRHSVAAISAGVVKGRVVLDLNYEEDAKAEVDLNVAMTGEGHYIDVQGTAESNPFDDKTMAEIFRLARLGVAEITTRQRLALENK